MAPYNLLLAPRSAPYVRLRLANGSARYFSGNPVLWTNSSRSKWMKTTLVKNPSVFYKNHDVSRNTVRFFRRKNVVRNSREFQSTFVWPVPFSFILVSITLIHRRHFMTNSSVDRIKLQTTRVIAYRIIENSEQKTDFLLKILRLYMNIRMNYVWPIGYSIDRA